VKTGWLAVLLPVVVACGTVATRPSVPTPLPTSVDALVQAISADAERTDHESDSKVRGDLAAEATRYAEACLAKAPQSASCLYGRAVSLGLEARAHPTRAGEFLNTMLDSLAGAESLDPTYAQAGPARVRALVLTRAPGWPLGPGDPEAGVAAARRAVSLKPDYPPNQLALAEALARSGDVAAARQSYARARDAAQASPASADRDKWLREADEGLRRQ
jgi:hypothetical protein